MNLRLYPMDIQTCPLIIESCEYNVCKNEHLSPTWLENGIHEQDEAEVVITEATFK